MVETLNGVSYINDSKATNVDSVYWALDAMKGKVIWIAGGQDKGNDYSQLQSLVKSKVKALVALGADNGKLLEAFSELVPVFDTHDMASAVAQSKSSLRMVMQCFFHQLAQVLTYLITICNVEICLKRRF